MNIEPDHLDWHESFEKLHVGKKIIAQTNQSDPSAAERIGYRVSNRGCRY